MNDERMEYRPQDDARPEDDCCYCCDDGHGSGLCPDCEAQRDTDSAELRAAVEALHVALETVLSARWARPVPYSHRAALAGQSARVARDAAVRAAVVVAFRKAGVKP